ncbi:MAG TPA: hypothetical protein VGK73_38735 [Polyangiaceae bacterium]
MPERTTLRILVVGCRNWPNAEQVRRELQKAWGDHGRIVRAVDVTVIVPNNGTGATEHAKAWAREVGATIEEHETNWGEKSSSAMPWDMKNDPMVRSGAHVCVAFWSGNTFRSGTLDCMRLAARRGIPMVVIPKRSNKSLPKEDANA